MITALGRLRRILTFSALLVLVGAALRLWLVTSGGPSASCDLARQLNAARILRTLGLAAVFVPPSELGIVPATECWSDYPYNYPPVPLFFFWNFAFEGGEVMARAALTILEALNALMVLAVTKQSSLALLYWLSPSSLWWASHEGQFEPLQNFFGLLSLLMLQRKSKTSLVLLAVAMQTKATAAALLPYVVYSRFLQEERSIVRLALDALLIFAMCVPTLYLMWAYQLKIGSFFFSFNSFHLLPHVALRTLSFENNSAVGLVLDQALSYALLALPIYYWKKTKDLAGAAPLFMFGLFAKLINTLYPWYFIVLPMLALALRDPRIRRQVFILYCVMDWRAVGCLVFWIFGV